MFCTVTGVDKFAPGSLTHPPSPIWYTLMLPCFYTHINLKHGFLTHESTKLSEFYSACYISNICFNVFSAAGLGVPQSKPAFCQPSLYTIINGRKELKGCVSGAETQKAWGDGQEEGQQWQQRGGEWRDVWNQLGDWAAVACIVVGVSQTERQERGPGCECWAMSGPV